MIKKELVSILEDKHQALFDWLNNHNDEKWESGPKRKWTTGQQVLHLLQSITALNKALLLPKIFLRYKFGISNRVTRDYDTVVERYKTRLAENENVVSPFSNQMRKPTTQEKQKIINALEKQKTLLQKRTMKWKEQALDKYILPHPLMGRMPIRELIMFTAYHTEHHTLQLKKAY